MGRKYIIAILFLLITGSRVYPEDNDSSGITVQKPLENLKLLPDEFHFIENENIEGTPIPKAEDIDLDQLLSSYSVYPSLDFNLTERIRSQNKNKSVTVWGGVVPFLAIPDPDRKDEDNSSSFSKENFSIFWRLKKKF